MRKIKFWNFIAKSATEGELLLYGPISESSWWDDEVTPKQFAEDLKALGDVSNLTVRINSGGGDVFAATSIYNLLKTHNSYKTVIVDGLAASAATIIMMAGDIIKIPSNAMVMVHDPMVGARGNTKVFMKMIDLLNKVKDCIIAAYVGKTGKSISELSDLMDKETWMTGKEAVEMGFADELLDAVKVAASLDTSNQMGLIFNNVAFDMSIYDEGNAIIDRYKKLMKGDEGMTFEEFLNSLDEAQKALVENAIEAARVEATTTTQTAAEGVFANERQTFENTIKDLQEQIAVVEDTEATIFANADPVIKAFIEGVKAKEAAAVAELNRIKDEKELADFTNKLKGFEALPVNTDEYAPILMKFARVDAEGVQKIEALLNAANECIATGKLFSITGSADQPDEDIDVWDQVQQAIKDMQEANVGMSYADAMTNVFKANAKLYADYTNSLRG